MLFPFTRAVATVSFTISGVPVVDVVFVWTSLMYMSVKKK